MPKQAEPPPPPEQTPPVLVEFNPLRLPILGDTEVEQIVDIIRLCWKSADQATCPTTVILCGAPP